MHSCQARARDEASSARMEQAPLVAEREGLLERPASNRPGSDGGERDAVDSEELGRLLARLPGGDPAALERVVRLLYDDLRGLARHRLRAERHDHTLAPTALVNEAYLRLARERRIPAGSRTQFFAVAATTMRRVLVDYARMRKRLKRGGGAELAELDPETAFLSEREADELIALEHALVRLAEVNPRAAEMVEGRFFGGLPVQEIAELRGLSTKTVQRDWILARAWLRREVGRSLGLPD